jgi:hypothetical protein
MMQDWLPTCSASVLTAAVQAHAECLVIVMLHHFTLMPPLLLQGPPGARLGQVCSVLHRTPDQ